MNITALVENHAKGRLKAVHGLSLYIETAKHKLLFDLGPDDTLFCNAQLCGIDLSQVDTVILSHGHHDHGGALSRFFQINSTAKVYVQQKAFEPHYSKLLFSTYIGLNREMQHHPQVVLLEGDYQIDDELRLFTVENTAKCYSSANDTLYENDEKDCFTHEQSLIITEEQSVLIMGCGHTGVVNILEKAAAYQPRLCVGGYHLFNPSTRMTVRHELLDEIEKALRQYPETTFHTCHCTGEAAFNYLSQKMTNLFYLSCGDTIRA